VHCHDSVALAALYPEDDGPEAREGVAAHWCATETLQGRTRRVGDVAPNGVTITEEMEDGAALYVGACLSRIDLTTIRVEQTLPATDIHEQCGGTSDTSGRGYEPYVLHVVDYKFGFGFVDAFENWQCLAYVSQLLSDLIARGEWDWAQEDVTFVEITIVQPRSFHRDGPVRSWRVRLSALRAHFNTLRNAAAASLQPNAKCAVGEYCRYCPARHACPTLQNAALSACDVAGQAIAFDLPPAAVGNELRRLHYFAKLLKARIDGLEVEALSMLRQGKGVPHFIADSQPGRLVWREDFGADAVIAMGDALGKDLRKPATPITPTQAAKAGIDASVIDAYAFRPRGEMKLVPFDNRDSRKIFGGNNNG
jgi:hypothetical protein